MEVLDSALASSGRDGRRETGAALTTKSPSRAAAPRVGDHGEPYDGADLDEAMEVKPVLNRDLQLRSHLGA